MKKINIKLEIILFLLFLTLFISIKERTYEILISSFFALLGTSFIEAIVHLIRYKRFKITLSSLISGLIVGLVISPTTNISILILSGIITILSKYLIRIRGRHIFNPAGLGIFSIVLLSDTGTRWWAAYYLIIMLLAGIYFAYRIKRLPALITYYISSLLLNTIYYLLHQLPLQQIFNTLNYFFIGIMVIEPKTSPFSKYRQIIFSLIVSISSFLFYIISPPFDGDLPALLIGNLLLSLIPFRKS